MYDLNGDGLINKHELSQFFIASLQILPTQDIRDVTQNFVHRIFSEIGDESTDEISLKQAEEYVRKCNVTDIYSMFGRCMITSTLEKQW